MQPALIIEYLKVIQSLHCIEELPKISVAHWNKSEGKTNYPQISEALFFRL